MKINVKRIPLEGEELAGEESAAIIGLDEPGVHFRKEISYRFHAQIQGNALLVTGTLDVPATLQCSRCLQEFEQALHVGEFVFHQELSGEDFVDLTANIREDIILELPQRALCTEECKGLCPQCGQDLNRAPCRCKPTGGDLHWHALDQLKLK